MSKRRRSGISRLEYADALADCGVYFTYAVIALMAYIVISWAASNV